MRLCLYQGTFNPVHNAHLRVAKFVYDNFKFDKIVFIPAYNPPHKNDFIYSDESAMHRLNMLNLATEPYPYFDVSEIEYKRGGISYTYLTILELYKAYNLTEKPYFIIGTDAFQYIEKWYESDKLKKLINFILFIRENDFDEKRFKQLKADGYNYILTEMDYLNISSSEVREKAKNCVNIDNVVPLEVANYINEYKLYRN